MRRDGLLVSLLLAWTGIALYRYRTSRVVRPGATDPARAYKWLLICATAMLAVALVAVNVWVITRYGVGALIPATSVNVIGASGLIALSVIAWISVERRRRRAGYVIADVSYRHTTAEISSSMRRINRSARTLGKGKSYHWGVIGDIGLDQLVYQAAEHAVVSSELSAAATKLKSSRDPDDQEQVSAATARVDEISRHLREVEASLARAAQTASRLSARLTRPDTDDAAHELALKAAAAQLMKANARAAGRLLPQ